MPSSSAARPATDGFTRPQGCILFLLALLASAPTLYMLYVLSSTDLNQARIFLIDATCFICAGDLATAGNGANPYDISTMVACATAHGKHPAPFFYPPWSLAIFMPLSRLPFPVAIWSLVGANVVSLAVSYILLWRIYRMSTFSRPVILLAGVFLGATQIGFHNISYGQVNLTALAFLAAFGFLAIREKPMLAGISLGMAILFKFHLIAFLIIPFLRRDVRTLAGALGTVVLASLGTLLVAPDMWKHWLDVAWHGYSYTGAAAMPHDIFFTSHSFSLSTLMMSHNLLPPDWRYTFLLSTSLIFLGAMVRGLRKKPYAPAAEIYPQTLALVSGMTFLYSPISWIAHYAFLLPLIFWLLTVTIREERPSLRIATGVALSLLVVSFELHTFFPSHSTMIPTLSVLLSSCLAAMYSTPRVQRNPLG